MADQFYLDIVDYRCINIYFFEAFIRVEVVPMYYDFFEEGKP